MVWEIRAKNKISYFSTELGLPQVKYNLKSSIKSSEC